MNHEDEHAQLSVRARAPAAYRVVGGLRFLLHQEVVPALVHRDLPVGDVPAGPEYPVQMRKAGNLVSDTVWTPKSV